jgi:hypothetical protein
MERKLVFYYCLFISVYGISAFWQHACKDDGKYFRLLLGIFFGGHTAHREIQGKSRHQSVHIILLYTTFSFPQIPGRGAITSV